MKTASQSAGFIGCVPLAAENTQEPNASILQNNPAAILLKKINNPVVTNLFTKKSMTNILWKF
jgi:hypothetical protein